MKKINLIIASMVAAGTFAVKAGDAGVDLVSSYVFRGVTLSDEVNIQPWIEGEILPGLTVGTWGSFDTDASEFIEVDYYAGYELPLGEDAPVSASIGYTEYTYPYAVGSVTGSNSVEAVGADRELSLSLGLDTILSPTVTYYYGVDGAIDKSSVVIAEVGHEEELEEGLTASAGASLAYLDPDGGESGLAYAQIDAGISYEYLSAGVSYIIETDDDVQVIDEDVYFTVGVSTGF